MQARFRTAGAALVISLAAVALTGCGRSAASAPARDHSADADADGGSHSYAANDRYSGRGGRSYGGDDGQGGYERTREPIPQFHGEPMWSDNRMHSARENAEYHFHKSGAELGARNLDDFLTKVHRFVDHPPPGALHLTRANGDRLIYDPKANLFAVVRRDGAPRTVFKPDNGMEYWKQQQARGSDERGYGRGGYRSSYRDRSYGGSGGGYSDRSYGRED